MWWNLYICNLGVVKLVRSNLAPDFPLFHARHRGLGLSIPCVAESSQVEVVVAVAVGGVLTILTIALIIIYILVTRDSALAWPWCCNTRPQRRQPQGSDISELGR